jgi:ubiquinone/menaquinone biosynthesis C-methylase UbiE
MNNLTGRFVVPDVVTSHFHLREGDVVADFGAGSGFFLKPLSEAVGPEGRVYACDIQKQLVEKLGEFIRLSNLSNVSPIWCDLEELNGTKLNDGALDAAILVNTLFQFEQKEVAIQEIRRSLKRDGVLHVIDWSESFSGLGPQQKDVITKDQAVALFESEQFTLEKEYPAGDHHYGFTVRKI